MLFAASAHSRLWHETAVRGAATPRPLSGVKRAATRTWLLGRVWPRLCHRRSILLWRTTLPFA